MNKFKRILTAFLIATMCVSSLSGCGEKKPEEVVYSLTPLDATQLETGKIYVKDGEKFYECPQGTKTFTTEEEIRDEINKEHTIMFGKDDITIPTLYKDQQLIYVTSETPKEFIWERYEDEGYTIGVINLDATTTSRYSLVVDPLYLLDGSSLRTQMSDAGIAAGEEIIFNKISSVLITGKNVSPAGSILGLEQDAGYSVDLYKGSEYISLTNVIADTHVFSVFELYKSQNYDYIETDYVTIEIPEEFMSGYYYLYGLGFFRYVDGSVADGQANVNFNVPYFYWDSEGNQYTYDEIKVNDDNKEEDIKGVDFKNTISVDCSNTQMVIKIIYGSATAMINGKETAINDSEVGYPKATMVGPDGSTYEFKEDTSEENTLICTIQSPQIGEWTTNISNMTSRKFDVKTSFTSGHSNSLVHTGSGTQKMTYFLPQSLTNGVFDVTWENTNRAAKVVIIDPNGTKYETSFEEGYGFKKFAINSAPSGTYTIEITGEDLGRVIINTSEK